MSLLSPLQPALDYDFPCFVAFFHFIVHPSGPRIAAYRWVKASYRWSGYDFGLNWPSGANLLAQKQHMYFFGASVTTARLFFFVIERVLT